MLQYYRLVHHAALQLARYSRRESAFDHDVFLEIVQHALTPDPHSCSAPVATFPPVSKLLVRSTY